VSDQCRQKLTWEPADGGTRRQTARCERSTQHAGPHNGQGYTWGKFGVTPPDDDDLSTRGALVEIIDRNARSGGPLVPTRVRVNGVDVGYTEAGSLRVNPGGRSTVASVTLTLLPARIVIRAADE
jgi:hypothetical protein